MLACKISFINEIANLCEHYGADVQSVRDGMCADHRIGKQFLYPGLGYGGSCFPKDTLAVMRMGQAVGYECKLNTAVHEVNQAQRSRFWQKVTKHFGGAANLRGKKLAFWGISFKPETDDIREAPAIALMKLALDAGADVQAYDPAGMANINGQLPKVKTVARMYDALDTCDALLVCTEWSEFRNPDFAEIGRRLKQKTIFDGRNIYRRQTLQGLGFTYHCVGRPPVTSKS
jgi:UDPglucose 6-dehydrogenase